MVAIKDEAGYCAGHSSQPPKTRTSGGGGSSGAHGRGRGGKGRWATIVEAARESRSRCWSREKEARGASEKKKCNSRRSSDRREFLSEALSSGKGLTPWLGPGSNAGHLGLLACGGEVAEEPMSAMALARLLHLALLPHLAVLSRLAALGGVRGQRTGSRAGRPRRCPIRGRVVVEAPGPGAGGMATACPGERGEEGGGKGAARGWAGAMCDVVDRLHGA